MSTSSAAGHQYADSAAPAAAAAEGGSDAGNVVALSDISVVFAGTGKRPPVQAVRDFSAQLGAGEFVSLLGPSGCGKSTTLRILAGLVKPTSGSATYRGEPITGSRPDVGIMFQQPNLLPWRTVAKNVMLPLQASRVNKAVAREKVTKLLTLVGLREFADHYPRQLSGGMQQRCAIARSLAQEPRLLLLDEPFGALDALTRETLNAELMRIWRASQPTVLLVTHSIDEAVFLSSRVLVMSKRPGTILAEYKVDLPYPRSTETLQSPEFLGHVGHLRAILTAKGMGHVTEDEAGPSEDAH
jgi:NitT/TauT family transport system ATP-binding protein